MFISAVLRQSRFILISLLSFLPLSYAQADTVLVKLTTNQGDILLQLDRAKAPISVNNFLHYVNSKHYDNTVFHRVIKDFMIQGGGFDQNMKQKPTSAPIKNEARNGLQNLRGSIAMARTASVDSATSQFFINVVDNHFLDHGVRDFGYAVFGKVVQGMDVVDKIATTAVGGNNVPRQPMILISASVVENASN